jgi:hypothetical protein
MDKRHAMHFARAECAPLPGAARSVSQTVNQSEVFEIAAGIIALSEWEPAPGAVRSFNGADERNEVFNEAGVHSTMPFESRDLAYFVADVLAQWGYRAAVQVLFTPTKSIEVIVNCSVEQARAELKTIAAMFDEAQGEIS